jgi:hypothetical protein
MSIKLGTQDLTNEIFRRQEEDSKFKSRLKGLTFNLLLVGTDNPDGNDWQYAIELQKGQFVNVGLDVQPAPSDGLRSTSFDKEQFDAKAISDHQTLYELVSGKLDLVNAITKVKIEGDIGKLMKQLDGFIGFLGFLATMDIEP